MTKYILEFYEKGQRKPNRVEEGMLPNGYHPRFTNGPDVFNFRVANRRCHKVKLRYKSNGALAAETYKDAHGYDRLRWYV